MASFSTGHGARGARIVSSIVFLVALMATRSANADDSSLSPARMQATAHRYYDDEMTVSYLFGGFGAVTAGGGAVALTQSGDFAHGFGFSSLVLGSLTVLGAVGYGVAVKIRGDYYGGLADTDLARYQREEAEHIAGTTSRFWLYLGFELAETVAGAGIATYGFAAKNDFAKGVGIGVATQGIGLFVIDVPGSIRAKRYQDDVTHFTPARSGATAGFSLGGAGQPLGASFAAAF
jgi:hypothetical protein